MGHGDDVVGCGSKTNRAHAKANHLAVIALNFDPITGAVRAFKNSYNPGNQTTDIIFECETNRDTGRARNDEEVLQRDINMARGGSARSNAVQTQCL